MLLPCLPCIATFIRMQIRQRFQIKGALTRDLMLWTCCIPCVATQEAKHVDHMCDVAQLEAEVMRRAEERKKEKERKIREQLEAKNNTTGIGGLQVAKLGKDEKDQKEELRGAAAHHEKHEQKHPTFLMA